MSRERSYLEGGYDRNSSTQIYRQFNEDQIQAGECAQKAVEIQEEQRDKAVARILNEKAVEKEMENLLNNYSKIKLEYLVDGAELKCSKAVPGITKIGDLLCNTLFSDNVTILKVESTQKGISANGLHYATVSDSKRYENIPPFKCNCGNPPDRQSEIDAITKDTSCKTEGTCKHLMKLSQEWDNLPSASKYLSFQDGSGEKKEGINMMSCLFCLHGGFITPITSGQTVVFGETWGKSPEGWSEEMVYAAEYVAREMYLEGYDLEFIAAMIGNIKCEGGMFGKFENSKYDGAKVSKPKYLDHMDGFHNYREVVSNKNLADLGMKALEVLKRTEKCEKDEKPHKFGLGAIQWTGSRGEELIKRYLDRFGAEGMPTTRQCAEVEIDFMLEELSGKEFKPVTLDKWNYECGSHTGVKDKINKAADILCNYYEKPKDRNVRERQEAARLWYTAFTGEKLD